MVKWQNLVIASVINLMGMKAKEKEENQDNMEKPVPASLEVGKRRGLVLACCSGGHGREAGGKRWWEL